MHIQITALHLAHGFLQLPSRCGKLAGIQGKDPKLQDHHDDERRDHIADILRGRSLQHAVLHAEHGVVLRTKNMVIDQGHTSHRHGVNLSRQIFPIIGELILLRTVLLQLGIIQVFIRFRRIDKDVTEFADLHGLRETTDLINVDIHIQCTDHIPLRFVNGGDVHVVTHHGKNVIIGMKYIVPFEHNRGDHKRAQIILRREKHRILIDRILQQPFFRIAENTVSFAVSRHKPHGGDHPVTV